MMLKLLVYALATCVFIPRKIERGLHEDLAFRMLAQQTTPRGISSDIALQAGKTQLRPHPGW